MYECASGVSLCSLSPNLSLEYARILELSLHYRFYDGGYLHLKSTIMRTHGAKELRDTIISTLRQDMIKIVQVCLKTFICVNYPAFIYLYYQFPCLVVKQFLSWVRY